MMVTFIPNYISVKIVKKGTVYDFFDEEKKD